MSRIEETIEQLRFLAENWERFSTWTRIQIIVTVWWYVKVRRPFLRLIGQLRMGVDSSQAFLSWLPFLLVATLAATALSQLLGGLRPQFSILVATLSAVFAAGLGIYQSSK